ncbi:MAG: gliding motility-associated C-terminal domain-containing protein [Bacteroidota bacterium]
MNTHNSSYRMLLRGLFLMVALTSTMFTLQAEGTQNVAPNQPDPGDTTNTGAQIPPVMLLTNTSFFGNFATPGTDSLNRLYVTIANPGEVINLGLSLPYDQFGRVYSGSSYQFRIVAEDGTVLSGADDILVDVNSANANNYAQAVFGSYSANNFSYSVNTPGNYYIEFYNLMQTIDDDDDILRIGFWDITVSDSNNDAVLGRVWSRNWAFRTPPIIQELGTNDECIWNRAFEGILYTYTGDENNMDGFVTQVDFTDSGFKGLSYNVAVNSTGPEDTGDIAEDRKSIRLPTGSAPSTTPEFPIFLNVPDENVFGIASSCADITAAENFKCEPDLCFDVEITGAGQVELILDFDLDAEFTPDSRDRVLVFNFESDTATCLPWDGLDNFGNMVGGRDSFNVVIVYAQGVQHFAAYDVEQIERGFCIETIRPSNDAPNCSADVATNRLYWDDTGLFPNLMGDDTSQSGTGQPLDGRSGCAQCRVDSCRTWTNFNISNLIPTSCELQDQPDGITGLQNATITGYGEQGILNTWWFSFTKKLVRSVVLLDIEINGVNPICTDDSTTYVADVVGGTAPYTFEWEGPNGFMSSDSVITVQDTGAYCVTIMDAAGCMAMSCDTLRFFEELIIEIDGPDTICVGDSTTYSAVVSGSGPFAFSWTGPDGFSSMDSAVVVQIGGEYCVTVVDSNMCDLTVCKTLNFFPDLSCVVDGPTEICAGEVASLTAVITGGTAPFDINWTGPNGFTGSGEVVDVLDAGEYCASITDANGCETECCITIEVIDDLTCDIVGPDSICPGDEATLTAEVSGCAPPFSFSWTGPNGFTSMEQSITVSEPGEYCATITDDNDQTTECCKTLTVGADISCEVIGPDTICVNDQAIYTVEIMGGTAPFDTTWTGPNGFTAQGASITISVEGEYCATVTGADGCSTECCKTLNIFEELIVEIDQEPDFVCDGDTVTLTSMVVSGQGPFTFDGWTGPGGFTSDEESIEVVEEGEYCASYTDGNNCDTTVCITVSPPQFTCEVTGPAQVCPGQDATLGVVLTGGTAPFTYSWTGPNGFTSDSESITVSDPGEYCVTVTDANGCETECCFTLVVSDISCVVEGPDNICVGDEATLTAIITGGTPPFTTTWTGPNGFTADGESITVSEPGEYCAFIVDANGCTTECCKTLGLFPEITCEVTGPDTICVNDQATFTVEIDGGEPPFEINWTGPGGFTASGESITISEEGEYCAMVTDANGCMTECCKTLNVFEELIVEIDQEPDFVCDGDTVILTSMVVSGQGPFTFDGWTGPGGFTADEESIEVLEEGEYCASYTDGNNCDTTVCITVSIPMFSCEVTGPDQICDDEEVTFTVVTMGGTPPFTYNWTGPNGFTADTESVTVSEAGEYCAVVTDANGCETECCKTLDVFPEITCEVTGPDTICVNDQATFSVEIDGGEPPFEINWTGPGGFTASGESITISEEGEYCAMVTDANGCTTECCKTLNIFEELIVEIDQEPDFVCDGDTVILTSMVVSGQGPFTFDGWTGPGGFTASEESIEVLEEGEYCASYTDGNNCDTTVCITVSIPMFSCEVTGPDQICDDEEVTFTVVTMGGTPPFTYNWTGPNGFTADTESVTVSEAGEYCAVVTDANGCETECCKTLDVFPEITCEVTGPDTICVNDQATFTVEIDGGEPPFEINWTGPGGFMASGESIAVSEEGEYCAMVTDANGCTTECCKILNVFEELIVEIDQEPDFVCDGDTVILTSMVVSGQGPFTFDGWTGPGGFTASEESIEVLEEGEYCASYTDGNNCDTTVCITVSIPMFSCTVEGPDQICAGDDEATLTAVTMGGTGPFTYSWTGPNGFMADTESITVSEPGEYCSVVTDANGCETECCKTLSVSDLSVEIDGPSQVCVGDDATLTAVISGGMPPYMVSWTGPGGFTAEGETITVSTPGEYCATVVDAAECDVEACFTFTNFPDLSCEVVGPDQICGDETATYTAVVTGGTPPFTFNWTGPGGFTGEGESITISEAGTYTATVTDANGCTTQCSKTLRVIDITVTITSTALEILLGESVTLTADAIGCESCTFSWTGPDGEPIPGDGPEITVTPGTPIPPNSQYVYTVTVTDDGLCPSTASITITLINVCDPEGVFVPNAFTPNGDDLNDVFQIEGTTLELFEEAEWLIYNRWGEEMFRSDSPFGRWDGTHNDEQLPPDVYGYYIRLVCPEDDGDIVLKGNVTLLR